MTYKIYLVLQCNPFQPCLSHQVLSPPTSYTHTVRYPSHRPQIGQLWNSYISTPDWLTCPIAQSTLALLWPTKFQLLWPSQGVLCTLDPSIRTFQPTLEVSPCTWAPVPSGYLALLWIPPANAPPKATLFSCCLLPRTLRQKTLIMYPGYIVQSIIG